MYSVLIFNVSYTLVFVNSSCSFWSFCNLFCSCSIESKGLILCRMGRFEGCNYYVITSTLQKIYCMQAMYLRVYTVDTYNNIWRWGYSIFYDVTISIIFCGHIYLEASRRYNFTFLPYLGHKFRLRLCKYKIKTLYCRTKFTLKSGVYCILYLPHHINILAPLFRTTFPFALASRTVYLLFLFFKSIFPQKLFSFITLVVLSSKTT